MATMAAKIEADLGPGTSAAVSDASGDGRHVVDLVSPSFAEAESTMQPQPTVCKAQCEEVSDEPSGRPYTYRYRGVSEIRNGRWRAQFKRAGKATYLGTFDDVAEAARAWDKMWLWCDEHDGAGGRKRDINDLNFGKDAYEGDLAYLRNVSKDDLVTALQAEGHEPYTSPFRGITLLPSGRWKAVFKGGNHRVGKATFLGAFDDEVEAAQAWDKMWLWCDEHDGAGGRKRDIKELNFGKDAYEGDLAYLRNVSKDDLVAALRAEAQRFRRRRGASGGRPVFGRAAARGSDRRGGTPGAVD